MASPSKLHGDTKQVFVTPWDTKRFAVDLQLSAAAIPNQRIDIPAPPRNWRTSLGFYCFSLRAPASVATPQVNVRVVDRLGMPVTGVTGIGNFVTSTLWDDTFYGIPAFFGPVVQRNFYPDGMLFERSQQITFLVNFTADAGSGLVECGYVSYRFENWS